MEFNENKPISVQVTDYCSQSIMSGRWHPGDRIPSTKDLAVQIGVNPRTVMKAYDELAAAGIIYQRRGMGYFAADNAPDMIREMRRRLFISETVPTLLGTMSELGITVDDLVNLIKNYYNE